MEFVDIFCEIGVFLVEELKEFLLKVKEFGFDVKIYVDEIDFFGGVEVVVEIGVVLVDYLVGVFDKGIEMFVNLNIVVILLLGIIFYLNKESFVCGCKMIDEGVVVVLVIDFNLGSCLIENI